MKKYFSILLVIVTVLFLSPVVLAQNCKVLDPDLAGVYTGECKNGKAEGLGKAIGTNTYEGEFKAGLPDGTGFKDTKGNSFKGRFKKANAMVREWLLLYRNRVSDTITGLEKKCISD